MTVEVTPKSKFGDTDSVTGRTAGSYGKGVGDSTSSCVTVLSTLIYGREECC